jgi:polar amino acid transport system substrate-binding protein
MMMFKVITLSFALSLPLLAAPALSPIHSGPLPGQSLSAMKNSGFSLPLDPQEIAFLQRITHINLCIDPDWMPYDYVSEQGDYIGINSDFYRLIARRIGKEIRIVRTVDWRQSLDYARQRKCDLLSGAQIIAPHGQFLDFSRPYIHYPLVIATRAEHPFIDNIQEILDRPLLAVKGAAIGAILKRKYPNIHLIEVENARTGLERVAGGKAFGYIDTVAAISYQTQKYGIESIKISGATNEDYAMSVAVRNDRPLLLNIIDKAVASLSEGDKLPIMNKWLPVKFEQKNDAIQTWNIFIAVGILLLLLTLREYVINRYKSRLESLNKELEQLSNTDSLTGIANRHFLNNMFKMEMARARRYRSKFSVILLDVDHFKTINDTFGHNEGDRILKTIAHAAADALRTNDTAGRWGGEEFLVLCPETDLYGAQRLAEAIRQKIERLDFGIPRKITISLGVAEYQDDQSVEDLVKRADDALYEAKNSGRNLVKTAR